MALVNCPECGRQISDRASACPHCGSPANHAYSGEPVGAGEPILQDRELQWSALAIVGILVLSVVVIIGTITCSRTDSAADTTASAVATADVPKAPVAIEPSLVNKQIMDAAVDRFRGLPLVEHTEWTRDGFTILARENGKSWQPVADSACVWIRRRGYQGSFSVDVIEASAALNKRWEQLAHARCS